MNFLLALLLLAMAPLCAQEGKSLESSRDLHALVETIDLMDGQLRAGLGLLEVSVEEVPSWSASFEEGWRALLSLRDRAGRLSMQICTLAEKGGSLDALLVEMKGVELKEQEVVEALDALIYRIDSTWALRAALESEMAEYNLLVDRARSEQWKLGSTDSIGRLVKQRRELKERLARLSDFDALYRDVDKRREEVDLMQEQTRGYIEQAKRCLE